MFVKYIYFGLFGPMNMSSCDEGIIPYLHVDYISYAVGNVMDIYILTKEMNYLFMESIILHF